jgi:hypothetical protein
MAKARKSAAKGRKGRRGAGSRRKTKLKIKRSKSKSKIKRAPARKARRERPSAGLGDKMASAVKIVADTIEESAEMRRKMPTRGGLSEG